VNLFLFFVVVLFWGFSFIAIRLSIETFPPMMAAGLRIFLGMVFLWIYAKVRKRPNPIHGKSILYMIGLGTLLFTIPWACLFWGEQYVHPSIASIINSTVPIFVLILSWMLLPSEQPTLPSTIGVLLGFAGMFFVFAPSIHLRSQGNEMMGMVSVFIMALSYAMGAVMMRKVPKGTDLVWAFIFQAFAASVTLALMSFVLGEKILDTTHFARSSWGLIYLASCSTAIASLIYYHLLAEWGALKAVAVTYLTPFVAIIVDLIVLHVHPKPNEYIGGSMIMIGILLIHWARTKNLHHSVKSLFKKT
jgi:drug/metabolite transporter (DMT)-like permease